MKLTNDILGDEDFLEQFENQTLDPAYFNHLGHLRLAWLYLHQYGLEKAITLTCSGIKNYAESLGADDKFHLTITDALVRILDKRIKSSQQPSWQQFLEENTDLIGDAASLLNTHFSQPLLTSEKARNSLVNPDRHPL